MKSLAVVLIAIVAATAAKPTSDAVTAAKQELAEVLAANAAQTSCGRANLNHYTSAMNFVSNKTSQALVGGTSASSGVWPFTVSICILDWFGTCNFHAAGAIISDRWVLTTWSGVDQSAKDTSFRVRAGTTSHKSGGQFITVQSILKMGDASTFDHYDDLAFIQLGSPLSFNDYVQPICLPSSDTDAMKPGNWAWVTAWGHTTGNTGSIQDNLREAQMYIGDGGVCKSKYTNYYSSVQLCVGGVQKGSGPVTATCNYDMGGPLMQQKNGVWYLYGLSATKDYGFSNCAAASIFTRISAFCGYYAGTCNVNCVN